MIRQLIGAVAVAASVAGGHAGAAQRVDLELVLLADASGSIDDAEIHFQRQGYAAAITHPEILGAIAQGYDQRIAVTYVEWGAANAQEVVVPWTIIDGPESAAAFAKVLLETPRRAFGRNAIGNAIAVGQGLIETNDIAGTRKVIDVSADSANNWGGISIAEARQTALAGDIVINGLAILCRRCSGRPNAYDLEAAFAERIIGGPASFVIRADGDARFTEAVRKKLLLEIAGMRPAPAPGIRLAANPGG
ncbi:MAG: DUF1194 domain-containing protein [Geminicoccaceae bacterium]